MSMCKLIPSLLVATLAVGMAAPRAEAQIDLGSGLIINDIDLEGVNFNAVTGLLTATGGTVEGTLAGLPFTTDIDNFSLQLLPPGPGAPDGCSVLDLALAPIDIDLLGLHVDTSAICLSITAIPGGGLLGDLLCGLAGGLDLPLGLDQLLAGLPGILNQVLGAAADSPTQPAQAEPADICDGECEVLDLALGPINLTLLGLNVYLDNCDDGPVQVCVSASAGEGLLGNLLCGLTDGGGILGNLSLLEDLLGILNPAVAANASPNRGQLNKLVREVGTAVSDGALSSREVSNLTASVAKLVRKG